MIAGMVLFSMPVFAGVTGKIAGIVTDANTKEKLSAVNVIIKGAGTGAATDKGGYYYIINVPVGAYSLSASMLGYKTLTKEDIKVSADLTTTVNFLLEPTAIQAEEVKVTAQRPLITLDATSTTHTMNSSQIERQPVRNFTEVVAQQSGVVSSSGGTSWTTDGLHIRGGRGDEVAYMVDGMSAQDRLTGRSDATVRLNMDAVEEVSVTTGGFNPEYGEAMSGIVNVVTKEGREPEGMIRYSTDRVSTISRDQDRLELSLGGPLVFHPKLLYFFSGELSSRENATSWYGPMSHTDREIYSLQGKLTYKITPGTKLKLSGFLSREQGGNYSMYVGYADIDSRSSNSFKYAPPEYRPDRLAKSYQMMATLTSQLRKNIFYELRVGRFKSINITGHRDWEKEKDRGWWEDISYKPWWTYDFDTYGRGSASDIGWATKDPNGDYYYPYGVPLTYGFVFGSPCGWIKRISAYDGAKFDLTSQLNRNHEVKFGIDAKIHTAEKEEAQYINDVPTVPVVGGDASDAALKSEVPPEYRKLKYALYQDEYNYRPKEFATYIQDKIEYSGFVVNGGLRFDYFDPSCWRYKDMLAPYDTLGNLDTVSAKIKYQLSPRLGIAFPVTERTVFHLSYGHFLQVSQFRWLYDSHNINLYTATGGWTLVSNPDLPPQHTIQYEIGVDHEIISNLALTVTGFYKDIYNLIGTRFINAVPKNYTAYQTDNYGNVLGVEFALRKRANNWLSGQLAYTIQYARGTSSYERETYYEYISNITPDPITGEPLQPPKIDYPLEFDQRHTVKLNIDFMVPEKWGPTIVGTKILENADINILTDIGSGLPYTKEDSKGQRIGEIGAEHLPWSFNTDLKFNKPFKLFGAELSFFALVSNLFDRKNVLNVYPNTGKYDYNGFTQDKATYLSQTWVFGTEQVQVGYSPSADVRRDLNNDGWISKDEWYTSYYNAKTDLQKDPYMLGTRRAIEVGIKINW